MKIELFYFEGCPHHGAFLPQLRELLDRTGIDQAVHLWAIESSDDAERERFLGSPTVRIDGQDVEAGADQRSDYGLKCRLYRTDSGLIGTPPDDGWIMSALAGDAGR